LNGVTFACSGTNSSDAQLAALGQQACVNGTSVVLATLSSCNAGAGAGAAASKRATRKSKAHSQKLAVAAATSAPAGIQQAQACADAFNTTFAALGTACGVEDNVNEIAGLFGKRADCATAQQAALKSVTAACPASAAAASDAESQLNDAANAGLQAGNLDDAASTLASATAQASTFSPPSTENCVKNSLPLAGDLAGSVNVEPTQPDLAAIAQKQTATNQAAVLSVVTPGCGAVADLQKANSTAFAAGVSQAQGQSCSDAVSSASSSAFAACVVTDFGGFRKRDDAVGSIIDSADCTAAQIQAVGLISTACPAGSA
jgi:hypothetical protein